VTGELQGLTAGQVAERVREGKVNTLPERSGRTTWQIVRDNVFTRVNAMLAVLFVIVAATMQFAQGAFAILIVANSIIGMVQELRAKRTLDNLAVIGEAHPVVAGGRLLGYRPGREALLVAPERQLPVPRWLSCTARLISALTRRCSFRTGL